jgi:hypothetical protein
VEAEDIGSDREHSRNGIPPNARRVHQRLWASVGSLAGVVHRKKAFARGSSDPCILARSPPKGWQTQPFFGKLGDVGFLPTPGRFA